MQSHEYGRHWPVRLSSTAVVLAALFATTYLSAGSAAVAKAASSTVVISYFSHAEPTQETVIGTTTALQQLIPAQIQWVPIDSAPPTVAAMRAGSIDMVTEVGNPPVTAAIANGTPLTVIWEGFNDSSIKLVVNKSIKSSKDLVGKTIGDLIGSSEDYEFQGWLQHEGLLGKVNVVGFTGEQTPVSAFLTGKIDGAYIEPPQDADMIKAGGHVLTTSEKIAKLGYYGINVTIVRPEYARSHRKVVQGYLCAVLKASTLMEGPRRDTYFARATAMTGQSPAQAILSAHETIYTTPRNAMSYLVGPHGTASSIVAKTYAKTSDFLVHLGRIPKGVTAQQVGKLIDASYLRNALKGKCR